MPGIDRIAAERKRQVEVKGWTPAHDDTHSGGELAEAASCYAAAALYCVQGWDPRRVADHLSFPWMESWKPSTDPIRNLEKAGALIAAEIDRLERLQDADSEENITGEAMPEPVAGGSAPWSSNPWVWVIEFNRRPA